MSPNDREVKKQLLLMKGEVLRVKLKLELDAISRSPLALAGEGLKAWSGRSTFNRLADMLPSDTLRQWLRRSSQLWLLWKLARKFWPRS